MVSPATGGGAGGEGRLEGGSSVGVSCCLLFFVSLSSRLPSSEQEDELGGK